MKKLVIAAAVFLTGCSTTTKQTYVQSPLFETKLPQYVYDIERKLQAANPNMPNVDMHLIYGKDIYQAFTLRYYGPTGPNKIFIYEGFLTANNCGLQNKMAANCNESVIAAVIAHEYGHIVHGHNDVHHKGFNTPKWKQHEADDAGMALLRRAEYDPCSMWKIAPKNLERKERILKTCKKVS